MSKLHVAEGSSSVKNKRRHVAEEASIEENSLNCQIHRRVGQLRRRRIAPCQSVKKACQSVENVCQVGKLRRHCIAPCQSAENLSLSLQSKDCVILKIKLPSEV